MPPLLGYLEDRFDLHNFSAGPSYHELKQLLDGTPGGRATYFDAVRAYASELYAARLSETGERFFLDKTPAYSLIVDEVVAAFPEAKFVFLLRNPTWILASVAETWHNGDIMKIMSAPARMNSAIAGPGRLAESMRRFRDRAVVVRYEDLVADPEPELRRVCNYLGVEYDDSMLSYSASDLGLRFEGDKKILKHDRPVQTSLPLPPLLRTAVGARFALRCLDRIGGETYEAMGYDFDATRHLLQAQKRRFPLSLLGDAVYALAWTKLLLWSIPRHYFAPRFKRDLGAFRRAWRNQLAPHYADAGSAEGGDNLAPK
jgi:hypothetical protein